jgi:hypothetical protein
MLFIIILQIIEILSKCQGGLPQIMYDIIDISMFHYSQALIGGDHQQTSERAAPPVPVEKTREGNWG